jgi:hypothetical protein
MRAQCGILAYLQCFTLLMTPEDEDVLLVLVGTLCQDFTITLCHFDFQLSCRSISYSGCSGMAAKVSCMGKVTCDYVAHSCSTHTKGVQRKSL